MKPKSLQRFAASVIKNSPGAYCIMHEMESTVRIKQYVRSLSLYFDINDAQVSPCEIKSLSLLSLRTGGRIVFLDTQILCLCL